MCRYDERRMSNLLLGGGGWADEQWSVAAKEAVGTYSAAGLK